MPSSFNLSDHSLQLWFARVGDESKSAEEAIEKHLSATENKRLQSTKSINKRREFLLSRALMRHALDQTFPDQENQWAFVERQNALPEIRNLPAKIFLSLSHSDGLICFAIARCRVGIDLEKVKERDFLELANIFMNSKELANLAQSTNNQSKIFYRNWCAKEAYYKAIPQEEQFSINLKDISLSNLTHQNSNWFILEDEIDNYVLAIVIEIEPTNVSHNYFKYEA